MSTRWYSSILAARRCIAFRVGITDLHALHARLYHEEDTRLYESISNFEHDL
jgi:hypothetical protein